MTVEEAKKHSEEVKAYDEFKLAVRELAELEEKIQAAQKRYQEALRALQMAAIGKA